MTDMPRELWVDINLDATTDDVAGLEPYIRASELAKAYEAIVALTDSLTLAKGIFTHYAVLHSGKCTPDGDAKSQANMQHADAAGRIIEAHNEVIKTAREQGK